MSLVGTVRAGADLALIALAALAIWQLRTYSVAGCANRLGVYPVLAVALAGAALIPDQQEPGPA